MRTDDRYIIHKCLNGDSAAFGILVDKYKASIYALAYSKLRNFHDAEDITQEAFIKAYRNLRTLRYWDDFPAWLYSITSNLCKNWIRSQSTRPDRDFVADQSPDLLTHLSMDSYRDGMTRESVHEALNSLPEIYRQVLTLYYFSGMSIREIGGFLRVPPNTIAQRLRRARARMKQEMIAMMSETFEERKLQADFTFRIVEAVKRIKIQPTPRTAGLPWGLSLATGIIIAVLSLNPLISTLNPVTIPGGSPLPARVKVLKAGEIPVDILDSSQVSALASKQGDGKDGVPKVPEMHNAAPMTAQGEGDIWTKKADMPTGRYHLSTSAVNGKIYAIGGCYTWDFDGCSPNVEEYDPEKNTWTKKADMLTKRMAFSTSAINGKIYAIGGSTHREGGDNVSTVEEYDPVEDVWTRKVDMPTARAGLSTSTVDGRIYAIGGDHRDAIFKIVEEYDPASDIWRKRSDMPTSRALLSTSAVNGKIYAIGGMQSLAEAFTSTVEEYDTGFVPGEGIRADGKFWLPWGKVKGY